MKEKLVNLRNALIQIETKGENTKIMADCIRYVEQLIFDCNFPQENHESSGCEK